MSQVSPTQLYTLTYDSGVSGFPSFYSYYADFMMGMNNYFYTWKGGDLYRHNTNPVRNQYYGENYPSTLTSIFNDAPLENKLWKTIELGGDDSWDTTLVSDQQDTGYIYGGQVFADNYYEEKEGSYFAFIRNETGNPLSEEFVLRSANGIGSSQNITTVGATTTIVFPNTMSIPGIIAVGDLVYWGTPTPTLLGVITQINRDQTTNSANSIVVDNSTGTVPGGTTEYIFTQKNSVAESHGILGHYAEFKLTNNNTEKVELYAVLSEVMKSFP